MQPGPNSGGAVTPRGREPWMGSNEVHPLPFAYNLSQEKSGEGAKSPKWQKPY